MNFDNVTTTVKKTIYDYSWVMISLTLILVLMIFWKMFMSQNFSAAPLIGQRDANLLGVGQNIRFAQDFTSTNQGSQPMGSYLTGKENLVPHSETPVFNNTPRIVDEFENAEGYKNHPGSLSMEGFAGPEEHLRKILLNQN